MAFCQYFTAVCISVHLFPFCVPVGWQKPRGTVRSADGIASDPPAENHKAGGSSGEKPRCGGDSAASRPGSRLWSCRSTRFVLRSGFHLCRIEGQEELSVSGFISNSVHAIWNSARWSSKQINYINNTLYEHTCCRKWPIGLTQSTTHWQNRSKHLILSFSVIVWPLFTNSISQNHISKWDVRLCSSSGISSIVKSSSITQSIKGIATAGRHSFFLLFLERLYCIVVKRLELFCFLCCPCFYRF